MLKLTIINKIMNKLSIMISRTFKSGILIKKYKRVIIVS